MNVATSLAAIPLHRHDALPAVDRLGVTPSHAVLDLGCGDGHHSRAIRQQSPRIFVSLDLSLEQLRILARRPAEEQSRSPVCADALALPFASATFDRVVCSLVFYLLPLERALSELHGLLKSGGRAYVRVPMLAAGRASEVFRPAIGLRSRVYAASHVLNGLFFAISGRQMRSPLVRSDRWACYVPRRRFEEAVARAGFRIDAISIDHPRPRTPSIDAWLVKQ
jgi:SAM-dependent methyltransferase